MLRIAVIVILVVFLLPYETDAQERQLRTWRTANGSYSVKARMVEAREDSVVLEKEDGKRVTVKLNVLSESDKKYVDSQNGSGLKRKSQRHAGEMEYRNVVILQADRELPWKPIDPGSPPKVELGELATFDFEGEVGFGPDASGLISDPSGSKLLFLTGSYREGSGQVFDLVSGKPAGRMFTMPAGCKPMALSADLKSLIVIPSMGGRGNVVWLAASASAGIRERMTWRYTPEFIAELTFARFIDEGLLITADSLGIISLWDLNARTLVWQIESSRDCIPAVSHDLKTLVSCNEDFLFQIDLQKSEVVSCVPGRILSPNCFAFSPRGDELICVARGSVRQIDTVTGETREYWNVSGGFRKSILGWVSDNQFLLGSDRGGSINLIDLRLKGDLRYYQVRTVSGSIAMDCDGRVWSLLRNVKGGISYTIEGNELPHESAREWGEQQDPDDFVLLKPGDSVNLEVSAIVHDATQAQVDRMREIIKSVSDEQFKRRRSGRGSNRGEVGSPTESKEKQERPKSTKDKLAEAMKDIRLPAYDASEEAFDILRKKLTENGLVVSRRAKYTLHVEVGHPDELTELNKLPEDVRYSHLPYSLRYHAWLTDENGERVWKSGSQSFSAMPSTTSETLPTTGPDGVEYVKLVDIPGTLVNVRAPAFSTIRPGGIDDQNYQQ